MVIKRGRPTFRETLERNQRSLDVYAALADRPRIEITMPPPTKKRAPSVPSEIPLESDVKADIVAHLLDHPMIGLVERVNSGSSVETNSDGTHRHVSFHHVYRPKGTTERLRASDLHCTLTGGPWEGRRLAIEVKRPGWTKPKDQREVEQLAYLERVRACGGYGIFAGSWGDVAAELDRVMQLPP